MRSAAFLLLAACLAVATANRQLLQDSSCPAAQNPASSCISSAATFQSNCQSYIQALLNKSGGQVTTPNNDDEIKTFVNSIGSSPSSQCCSTAVTLLKNACICSTAVQNLAKQQQNLTPKQLVVVGKVFMIACNQPTCNDACRLPSNAG